MIRKGQMKDVEKEGILGQVALVSSVFGVAAAWTEPERIILLLLLLLIFCNTASVVACYTPGIA